MTSLDALGHLGGTLILAGGLLLGQHCILGWPVTMLGSVVWLYIGFKWRTTSIMVWMLLSLIFDGYNWWSWST